MGTVCLAAGRIQPVVDSGLAGVEAKFWMRFEVASDLIWVPVLGKLGRDEGVQSLVLVYLLALVLGVLTAKIRFVVGDSGFVLQRRTEAGVPASGITL